MPSDETALVGGARRRPILIRVGWAFVGWGVLGGSALASWPADAPNPPPAIDPRLIVSLPSNLDQAMAGTPNGLHVLADAAYSFGATVAPSGDVYFTEFANQRIQRYNAADGSVTTIVTDRPNLYGITSDRQGNIFYAQDSDVGTGRIVKRTPAGGEQVICSGLTRPRQLSTDADGNVYAVLETRSIVKWDSATGNVQTVVNSLQIPTPSPPQGVAVASDGRIYFSTYSETGSYGVMLQPGGVWVRETNGSITQVAGGLWRARGLAFNPNGRLYAVTEANAWDQGNSGLLVEIDPARKTTKTLLAGIDYAQFPAVGPDGRVYVTAARDEKLVAYDPAHQFASQAIAEPDLALSVENATWRETAAQGAFPFGLTIDTVAVGGYLTFGQGASDASLWLKVPASRFPAFEPNPPASLGPGFFRSPTVTVDWRYGDSQGFAVPLRDHVRCRWPMTDVGTVNESPAPDFSEDPEAYLVYADVKAPATLSANRWKGGGGWSSPANWSTGTAPTAISGESWVEPLGVWSATSFPVVVTAGNKVQNLVLGDDGVGVSLQVAGGTLDATGSIRLGEQYDATVSVISGSLTAAGDLSLSTSGGRGDGTLNVRGGAVTVGGQLLLGWNAHAGTLTMSGGSVGVGGVLIFNLDGGNAGAKEARVNLFGGTLTAGGLSINTLDPARLDLSGGRFVLPASNLGNVNYWINSGNITALDGRRTVDVVPAPGDLIVCSARRLATDVVIDVASGSQTQAQAGYPSITAATWLMKTGPGEVVLDSANSYPGMTSVTAGRLRIAHASAVAGSEALVITGGEVSMPADRPLDVSLQKLSIIEALGSRLDIGAGRVEVAAGGIAAADLMADLLVGRNGGSWDGIGGIVSSAVASALASSRPRAIGWLANDDGSFTIAAAAPGDNNLDTIVDLLDAANLLAGGRFDTGMPADWSLGDTTYDGIVDILDVADFLGTGLFDAGSYDLAIAGVTGPVAAVPEPTLWPLAAATIGLMATRCRRPGWPRRHAR
jgi:autotransporter-associated beta strand protein